MGRGPACPRHVEPTSWTGIKPVSAALISALCLWITGEVLISIFKRKRYGRDEQGEPGGKWNCPGTVNWLESTWGFIVLFSDIDTSLKCSEIERYGCVCVFKRRFSNNKATGVKKIGKALDKLVSWNQRVEIPIFAN